MKILIVDDDLVSRKYISRFLTPYGELTCATNGAQALESFKAAFNTGEPYDLVCLDIEMPA